jgi:hypothetical protein
MSTKRSTAKTKVKSKSKKSMLKRVMRGGGGYAALVGGAAAASRSSCPPGVMCLSSGLSLFLIVAALFVALAVAYMYITRPATNTVREVIGHGGHERPINIRIATPPSGDGRYAMPPQPLRDWRAAPEFPPRGGIASIPINIPTQGLPESFQSIGVMTLPDGKVLPLMGRRTAGSNDRWNYYTRTDTYNPVPLPLEYNKRDCMDDTGCNEVYNGDALKLGPTGETGTVSMYRFDGPKYIPGLI